MIISDSLKKHNRKIAGFATLVSVLAVGAMGVVIVTSFILLGVGNSRTSLAYEQSNGAKALANACAEEALQQVRSSTPFTGSGSLSLGQGTCSYAITSQGAQNRSVTSTGVIGTITRKVKIIIDQINPTIRIVSWQEVADF